MGEEKLEYDVEKISNKIKNKKMTKKIFKYIILNILIILFIINLILYKGEKNVKFGYNSTINTRSSSAS